MPSSDGSVSFDELLNSTILPPPGPAHYAARRALWLKPRLAAPRPPEPSTSRDRLTTLLNMPNAINNDQVWKAGIEKVWKGLNDGGLLKRRLPMELVIKITQAAWLRDNIWPPGGIAPEPDDVLLLDEPMLATEGNNEQQNAIAS